MFDVTHFRTEFVRHTEAAILRRVNMTQFMLVISCLALAVGVFHLPYWTAPLWMVLGYLAGHVYRGEQLYKRAAAYLLVQLRLLAGRPRQVSLAVAWTGPAPSAPGLRQPASQGTHSTYRPALAPTADG